MHDSWRYPIRYKTVCDTLRDQISTSGTMSWENYLSYIELNQVDKWLQLLAFKGKLAKWYHKRIQIILDKLESKHGITVDDSIRTTELVTIDIDSPLQYMTNYKDLKKYCIRCLKQAQQKVNYLPNGIKWQCQSSLTNLLKILHDDDMVAWYPIRISLIQCKLVLFPFKQDKDVIQSGIYHPMLLNHLKWLKLNLYDMTNVYWDNLVTQIVLLDPFTMSNYHSGVIRRNEHKDLILQLPSIDNVQIKNYLENWTLDQFKVGLKQFLKQGKWVYKGPLYIYRFIYCFFEIMSYDKSVAHVH